MTVRFNVEDTGFMAGDAQGTLRGNTFDGTSITGTDSVRAFFPGDVDGDSDVDTFDAAIWAMHTGLLLATVGGTLEPTSTRAESSDILDAAQMGVLL